MPYGNEAKIDGRHIVSANAAKSYDGRPVIRIAMDTKGSHEWKIMTTNNIGKAIAIVIDDHVITCPVVTNAITGGETEISGNFTVKEAEELAARIYAGIK
jgi:SecD/SecF fusion protein